MIQISQELSTNAFSNIIARANKIAYTTKLELGYEVLDKSVADKISELESAISNGSNLEEIQLAISDINSRLDDINLTADNVIYSLTTSGLDTTVVTVKDKLDSISRLINELDGLTISENAAKAQLAATLASASATLAQTSYNAISNLESKVNTIAEAATTFNTAFDADASFAIVSEADYTAAKNNGNLNNNCIYFCYKP